MMVSAIAIQDLLHFRVVRMNAVVDFQPRELFACVTLCPTKRYILHPLYPFPVARFTFYREIRSTRMTLAKCAITQPRTGKLVGTMIAK